MDEQTTASATSAGIRTMIGRALRKHPRSVAIFDATGEAAADADQPFEEGAHDAIDVDLRHRLISEAAFELYTRRGFADGYDLEDWLQAEAEVDHVLLQPASETVPDTTGVPHKKPEE
jgi:hypothetical protein